MEAQVALTGFVALYIFMLAAFTGKFTGVRISEEGILPLSFTCAKDCDPQRRVRDISDQRLCRICHLTAPTCVGLEPTTLQIEWAK